MSQESKLINAHCRAYSPAGPWSQDRDSEIAIDYSGEGSRRIAKGSASPFASATGSENGESMGQATFAFCGLKAAEG